MRILIICFFLFVITVSSSAQIASNKEATVSNKKVTASNKKVTASNKKVTASNKEVIDAVNLLDQWRKDHSVVCVTYRYTGSLFGQHSEGVWSEFCFTENQAATWRILTIDKSPDFTKGIIFPHDESVYEFFPQAQEIVDLKDSKDSTAPPIWRAAGYLMSFDKSVDLDALQSLCKHIFWEEVGDQQKLHFVLRPELWNLSAFPPRIKQNFKPELDITFDNDGQINYESVYYTADATGGGKVEYESFENNVVQKNAPILPSNVMNLGSVRWVDAVQSATQPSSKYKSVVIGLLILVSISFLALILMTSKGTSKSLNR